MLAAATVTNIKTRYDAKTPQFAIFGTRVICMFYSMQRGIRHSSQGTKWNKQEKYEKNV